MVRQYFPAGTSFDLVTHAAVARVQNELNSRPRKVLDYRSPDKVSFVSWRLAARAPRQPGLLVALPIQRFVAAARAATGCVVGRILRLCARQPFGQFTRKLGLDYAGVVHRLVLGGVCFDFGAVDRDMVPSGQPSLSAQCQHLHE
jgi:hypothetical protein